MTEQDDRCAHNVRDNADASRYELIVDDRVIAFAEYRRSGDVVVLPHTVTAPSERGNGWGTVLVAGALDDLRRQGRKVVAQCWFVAEFLELHPDYADLVA